MTAGGKSRRLRLYAVHGLGYQPTCVWLDERGDFFAQVDSWFQLVPEEWESTGKELLAAQDARLEELRRQQIRAASPVPATPLLIEHANLFDAATRTMKPGTSVLIEGNTIRAVGPDGSLTVPKAAERIDAAGRALLPGLWDMHSHPEPATGCCSLRPA